MAKPYEYKLQDKLIWDFTPLEEFLNKDFKITDLNSIAPKYIESDIIEFCYVIFNVKSVVDTNADSNDIINGFSKVKKEFPNIFEYLNETILGRFFDEYSANKLSSVKKAISLEPIVTILLKFSYWYYKCSPLWEQSENTSEYSKKSEVRSKITAKFLRAFNVYHHSLKYEKDFENETELKEWLKKEAGNLPPSKSKNDPHYKKYIYELKRALTNIISELMLAVICSKQHAVTFDTSPSSDHDYDFILDSIGTQVKTLSDDLENLTQAQEDSYMRNLMTDGKIDQSKLEKALFKYILDNNRLDTLEKAIDQKARVIFLNLSDTLIGTAVKYCLVYNNLKNTFYYCLNEAIKIAQDTKSSYLPLIIFVEHAGYDYFFDGFHVMIPVIKENGIIKMDRAKMQGFSK